MATYIHLDLPTGIRQNLPLRLDVITYSYTDGRSVTLQFVHTTNEDITIDYYARLGAYTRASRSIVDPRAVHVRLQGLQGLKVVHVQLGTGQLLEQVTRTGFAHMEEREPRLVRKGTPHRAREYIFRDAERLVIVKCTAAPIVEATRW